MYLFAPRLSVKLMLTITPSLVTLLAELSVILSVELSLPMSCTTTLVIAGDVLSKTTLMVSSAAELILLALSLAQTYMVVLSVTARVKLFKALKESEFVGVLLLSRMW